MSNRKLRAVNEATNCKTLLLYCLERALSIYAVLSRNYAMDTTVSLPLHNLYALNDILHLKESESESRWHKSAPLHSSSKKSDSKSK